MSAIEIENRDRLSAMRGSRYRISGTHIRFGWDSLVGFPCWCGSSLGDGFDLVFKANNRNFALPRKELIAPDPRS